MCSWPLHHLDIKIYLTLIGVLLLVTYFCPTFWNSMDFQASLSFTISQSCLKLLSIQSVMLSNHFILCCPLLLLPSILPSIRVFSNKSAFTSGVQSAGTSASASVLPIKIQGWFRIGLTGLISLLSKRLSGVFSSTTIQKHRGVLLCCYSFHCCLSLSIIVGEREWK